MPAETAFRWILDAKVEERNNSRCDDEQPAVSQRGQMRKGMRKIEPPMATLRLGVSSCESAHLGESDSRYWSELANQAPPGWPSST